MTMRAAVVIVALLMTSIAGADGSLHVHPFGPKFNDPIDLHFVAPCGGGEYVVSGSTHDIVVTRYGICYGLPTPTDAIVRLGTPYMAGKQHVRVQFYEGATIAEGDYFVRDEYDPELRLRPRIVPVTGGVRMRLDGVECSTADCAGLSINTTGGRVLDYNRGPDGVIWFTAPPHAEGFDNVYVDGGSSRRYSNSVYYASGYPRDLYERVLFPVLAHTRGFGGSDWVSEGVIANPNPWFVSEELSPGAVLRIGEGHPHGFVYAVPRYDVDSLAFALRIRDASRANATLGTRVPVVREKDMVHGRDITLLDVPRDPRFRIKIRVYAFDPMIDAIGRLRVDGEIAFAMTRSCTDCALEPYYAELDLSSGSADARADITITPPRGSLAWAFATITNNETQEVTIVTP